MSNKHQYKTGDIYQSNDKILIFIVMSSLCDDNIIIDRKKYCFKAISFDLSDHLFYDYWINNKDVKINV